MTTFRTLLSALLISAAVLLPGCDHDVSNSVKKRTKPPERIILIVIDMQRKDYLSPYGSTNRTPNIEALAEHGQVFSNFAPSFHQTTMSMASLFTGHTPSIESGEFAKSLAWNGRNWCGMRRFAEDESEAACLPASLTTLAESLKLAGYWTAGIASNALMFKPTGYDQGFFEWIEVGGKKAWEAGRRPDDLGLWNQKYRGAAEVVRATQETLDARPTDHFFLYVHFMDTHDYRFMPPQKYPAGVARSDGGVGGVLAALKERGLLEGSVVFLISDHGERLTEKHFIPQGLRHNGNPSFEELLRVPLIVYPAIYDDTSRFLRTDDLTRMIKELAGISTSDDPVDLQPGELFLSEMKFRTYRKGPWKSFQERKTGKMYLVNLERDPDEQVDVAVDHPDILEQHRKRTEELAAQLRSANTSSSLLTPEDEERLRELGYIE